jgi:thymidine phosphorylase
MEAPLGRAVGNALEVAEAIATLKEEGPDDLTDLSVTLAARMLILGDVVASEDEATERVRAALSSGKGLEKLREIIRQQGGDPRIVDDPSRLPRAPHRLLVEAECSGYVTALNAELVGRATMQLGAGRDRVDHGIDPSVGAILRAVPGQEVRAGDALVEVHYRDSARLDRALQLLNRAWRIEDAPPQPAPLILETVTS